MADKSFGVKDINLIGASGTPEIESPNNLNIKAVNVAISTDMSVGGTINIGSGTSISSPGTNILSVGTGISESFRVDSNGHIRAFAGTNPTSITDLQASFATMNLSVANRGGSSAINVVSRAAGAGQTNIVLRSIASNSGWAGAEFRAEDYSFKIRTTEILRLDGSGFNVKRSSEQFNSFTRTGSTSSGDYIGNLAYKANDSAGNETEYVKLISQIVDNTNGSEDSRYQIETLRAGSLTQSARAESGYFLTPSNPGIYLDALDWSSSNNYMHNGFQFWQVGSNWNNSTGTFTCPVAGKYFLAADAQGHNTHTQSGASALYANLVPRVNNSDVGSESVATTRADGGTGGNAATHSSFGFSIILNCSAGDTIRVHSNHGFRTNTQNHLSIYLLG